MDDDAKIWLIIAGGTVGGSFLCVGCSYLSATFAEWWDGHVGRQNRRNLGEGIDSIDSIDSIDEGSVGTAATATATAITIAPSEVKLEVV